MSSASRRREAIARAVRPPRAAGFTLLEVLAAVALLGLLYTVLARVAIEGLRAEGESARRLEATLIADARMDDLPSGIYWYLETPELGHTETTEGDYTVSVDVTRFEPPAEWGVSQPEDGATPMLFAPTPEGGVQGLRTIQLTVAWLEGAEERRISRIHYLIDMQLLTTLWPTTGQTGAPPQGSQTPEAPETPEVPEIPQVPSELEPP